MNSANILSEMREHRITGEILRKIVHMSVFLMVVPALFLLPRAAIVLMGIFLSMPYVFTEYLRRHGKRVFFFTWLIEKCSRKEELNESAFGPLYLLVAVSILIIFFDQTSAYLGVAAITLGDGFAGIIGRLYGRHTIYGEKTLEGSSVFFVATFASFLFMLEPWTAFITAFFSTVVELLSGKYDNITVPFSPLIRFLF